MREKIKDITKNAKKYFKEYIEDIKEFEWKNGVEFLKKRKLSVAIVILTVFLICGYAYGTNITSKGRALKTLEVALKNGREGSARKVIRVNDKEVEKERLLPYIEYYNGDRSKVDSLMNELKNSGKSEHAELKSVKKFFGEDYYVNLKTYNLKVNANFKEASVYIDEEEQISPGETIRGLVPGTYSIKGILSTEFGDIVEEKEYVVDKDAITELAFKASKINLDSNFEEAEVFINGEKSEFLAKDIKNFGPIPQDGSVSIRVEKELPWGRIKSDEIYIKDIESIKLNLNVKNEELEKEVFKVVEEFYVSVFEALNEEDEALIINATENAKGKIYDELKKKYFIFKNKYSMISSTTESGKNVFEYNDGKFTGTIVIDMDYEVSKVFLGLGKENKNKKFFTNVIYKDGNWMVENVENFSL